MNKNTSLILLFWFLLPFAGTLVNQQVGDSVLWTMATLSAQAEEAESPSLLQQLKTLVFGDDQDDQQPPTTIEEKYGPILSVIHGEELALYDSLQQGKDIDWDRYQGIVDLKFKTADTTLAPNIQVFGWHPYWMGTAYNDYDFGLLSHVSWFAYHIDPATGGYTNPEVIAGWRTKALQDLAAEKNPDTKVLLTIASHTTAGNREFLKNEYGQQEQLIDTLIRLLEEGAGHGIDVNFELMPRNYEKAMTDFLEKLSNKIKGVNRDYLITVVLPKVNSPRIYDIAYLQDYVDYFLITGYDFHTGNSLTDGPIAPLRSRGKYSIENSVFQYLEEGLDRKKLILGLPYYGGVWKSQSPEIRNRDTTLSFVQHLTYRAIQAKYCINGIPSYDHESWSAYFILPSEDSSYYEKIWFDDSTTLARKYDWVLEQELGGIGIWALGYDNGDPRLWQLLAQKYASDTIIVYQDPYLDNRIFNLADTLYEYQTLVIIAGLFLILFVSIGLIASLFDWRVREVFFSNKTLRLFYIMASFALLLGIVAFVSYVNQKPLINGESVFTLGFGLLLGGGLTIFISRWFNRSRKQLP